MESGASERDPELVKMATLSRRSGVPAATIKHYLREGLLPGPVRRSGRNMAWYDASLVGRIRAIKQLQREHFLPLSVIKNVLDGASGVDDDQTTAQAIARVLAQNSPEAGRTRAELLAQGVRGQDLDWLQSLGLVTPDGPEQRISGDDLALLRTLGAARRAGIRAEMLPTAILEDYARAIRELVRVELSMFRAGVMPLAGDDLDRITGAATSLSERLVLLIRRKMLLPTLEQLVREANETGGEAGKQDRPRKRPVRRRR
jgi:DNA-binding transcriptional MerR regulator